MFRRSGLTTEISSLVLPVLSPGKHRNPRKGACFMEFASYLAGERWSDRPACTHPALAELARAVNDHLSDEARTTIVPLVPEVIGLTGDDPSLDLVIARECAITALPIVSLGRARVIALGLLRCEHALAREEGREPRHLSARSRDLLDHQPSAYRWALDYCEGSLSGKTFRGISAAAVIDYCVLGISEAAVDDPDSVLVGLLEDMIALCQQRLGVSELFVAASPAEPIPH